MLFNVNVNTALKKTAMYVHTHQTSEKGIRNAACLNAIYFAQRT